MELNTASAITKVIILGSYSVFLTHDFGTAFFCVFCAVVIGYLFNRVKQAERVAKEALTHPETVTVTKTNFVTTFYKGFIVSLFISTLVLMLSFHFSIGVFPTMFVALAVSSRPKLLEKMLTEGFTRIIK